MGDAEYAYAIPIDPGDIFWAIPNGRRHQTILSLVQSKNVLTVSELTMEIATIENLVDPSEVTSEQWTRVYVLLVQSHLRILDQAGVVEYDGRGKRVPPTDATEPVAGRVRRITTACYRPDAGRGDESQRRVPDLPGERPKRNPEAGRFPAPGLRTPQPQARREH